MLIQGITEALPISSSMHLNLFGQFNHDLAAYLHISAAIAFIFITSKFLKYRFIGYMKNFFSKFELMLAFKIFLFIIPTIIIGYFIRNYDFNKMNSNIPYYNIIASILLITSDFLGKNTNIMNIKPIKCITMGLLISLAFIPGISRMGITYTAFRICKMRIFDSLFFTILLGIPITLGASCLTLIKNHAINSIAIIILPTAIITYFILKFLFKLICFNQFFHNNFGKIFGIYRIILSILLIINNHR